MKEYYRLIINDDVIRFFNSPVSLCAYLCIHFDISAGNSVLSWSLDSCVGNFYEDKYSRFTVLCED